MTSEERRRIVDLITHPPPGSKLEAARNYGIGLRELDATQPFLEELRHAAKRSGP
jgi:hypothetical protein